MSDSYPPIAHEPDAVPWTPASMPTFRVGDRVRMKPHDECRCPTCGDAMHDAVDPEIEAQVFEIHSRGGTFKHGNFFGPKHSGCAALIPRGDHRIQVVFYKRGDRREWTITLAAAELELLP